MNFSNYELAKILIHLQDGFIELDGRSGSRVPIDPLYLADSLLPLPTGCIEPTIYSRTKDPLFTRIMAQLGISSLESRVKLLEYLEKLQKLKLLEREMEEIIHN